MLKETHFSGRDGFYAWVGVVENRIDPLLLGRVQVRVLGSHTPDKSYIKSQDLHYAYPLQPLTSAAMNGIGSSPLGPVPGTWCFGFYRDGEDMQDLIILGTLGKIPQSPPDNTQGFNDPRDSDGTPETLENAPRKLQNRVYPFDGSGAQLTPEPKAVPYPRITNPLGCIVGEPDTNRIARNQNINDTIIGLMNQILDNNVPIAFGGTWNEDPVWYVGEYPFVHVDESESGHIKVWDDTPLSEGSLNWDRTGTHTRVDTEGSEVHKIVQDGYTIVLRKNFIHIMNDQDEFCQQDYNLKVGGRWNIEVTGNINLLGHQNLYAQILGDANLDVEGNINVASAGSVSIKSAGAIKISSGSKISVTAGTSMDIVCGTYFAVDAANIYLNSGVANPDQPTTPTDPKQ